MIRRRVWKVIIGWRWAVYKRYRKQKVKISACIAVSKEQALNYTKKVCQLLDEDDNDFKWIEGVDCVDYNIGKETLCISDVVLDDKTNTLFNNLDEIKKFYKLCQCEECNKGTLHKSDYAVHNDIERNNVLDHPLLQVCDPIIYQPITVFFVFLNKG